MYQQSILDSLRGIFDQGFQWDDISQLNPEQISQAFAREYDIQEQDLPSSLFQTINPQLLGASEYKTYSPIMQTTGQSLLSDLKSGLEGADTTKAYGGFGKTYGTKARESQVRDVFGKQMGKAYSDVRGMQTERMKALQDSIDTWHKAAQSIKGY